jgi:hypothetical protein
MWPFKKEKILSPEERKAASNEKLRKLGIAVNENLPVLAPGSLVHLKSLDDVCDRAITCMASIQLALSIANGYDYVQAKASIMGMLKQNQSDPTFLPNGLVCLEKESAIWNGSFTKQDLIDIAWSYECYWSLVWALDMITDKELQDGGKTCNVERAVALLPYIRGKLGTGKLRSVEKILDMTDLFYRYHWACEEKRIHPDTSTGQLKSEVVLERRRGLEWLISEEQDWNEIRLDT